MQLEIINLLHICWDKSWCHLVSANLLMNALNIPIISLYCNIQLITVLQNYEIQQTFTMCFYSQMCTKSLIKFICLASKPTLSPGMTDNIFFEEKFFKMALVMKDRYKSIKSNNILIPWYAIAYHIMFSQLQFNRFMLNFTLDNPETLRTIC